MKPIGLFFMTTLFPSKPGDKRAPERRYEIELPSKVLTYACVGFNAVVAPHIIAFINPWKQ
jgi:hypothetical protein